MGVALAADRIDAALEAIETWVREADCPGASVAITDADGVVAARGIGHATLDPERPATDHTRYAVGSVTKPITALAVALLEERDRIDLQAPVSNYVPYFEDVPGEPVTVAQLLSHTSGMPADDLAFVASEFDGWDDFHAFVEGGLDRRRVDEERFLYYNGGYAVLDRMVEAVADVSFASFVEREVFEPLGMNRSGFDTGAVGVDADGSDVLTPYVREDGEYRVEDVAANPVFGDPVLRAAGGLLTTVTDLARFLQAHLGGESPISTDVLVRTRTPQVVRERFVDGTERRYGYGWDVEAFGPDTLIGHAGNTGGSAAFAGFLDDFEVGMVLACNALATPKSAGREALAALVDVDRRLVDPEHSVTAAVRTLTGRYESYGGVHAAEVRWTGDALEVAFEGGDQEGFAVRTTPLKVEDDRFAFTDVDRVESTTDVEFFRTDDGAEFLFDGGLFRRVDADLED